MSVALVYWRLIFVEGTLEVVAEDEGYLLAFLPGTLLWAVECK